MRILTRVKNNILTLQTVCGYSVNTTGLIKQSIALNSQLDFLQPYATFADDLLVLNYSDYKVKNNISPDTVKLYVCNALLSEKYNLETLIGTLDLDYDPIENYNMVEDGTDNRTLDYAAHTTDSSITTQQKTNTNTLISAQKVNTHGVTPYNTTAFTNTEQNTQGGYTDKTTVVTEPYTDKSNTTIAARTDTDGNIHHLTRRGNVGVTTSQTMIESERALANVNISARICEIVIKNICKGVQLTL